MSEVKAKSKEKSRGQHGGKYVGKGAYGCSFTPAPRCRSGKRYRSADGSGVPTLGKIVYQSVTEEFEISKTVMHLPSGPQFFAAPTRSCEPADPIDDPDADECVIKHMSGEPTMLIMPFAGEQLVMWAMNLSRLASQMVPMMRHLLKGIQLYQTVDIVHNDIHMGNIVVDKEGIARFIDFGLAFHRGSVKGFEEAHHNREFSPRLVWHPPEVQAMRISLGGLRMAESVAEIEEENPELVTLASQFPERASGSLLNAMTRFVQTGGSTSYGAFVRTHGFKFDSWRIGLCFWFMWNDLITWPGLRFSQVWSHREAIRTVLAGLTDFDPRTRMTIQEALAALK